MLPKMVDTEEDEFGSESYPEYDELSDNLHRAIASRDRKMLKTVEIRKGERKLKRLKIT